MGNCGGKEVSPTTIATPAAQSQDEMSKSKESASHSSSTAHVEFSVNGNIVVPGGARSSSKDGT